MKMLTALIIVFLAVGAVAAQSRVTNEEYTIFGFVLTDLVRERNRRNPGDPEMHLVIASKASKVDTKWLGKGEWELYRSTNNRNKGQAKLHRRFPVRFSYSIADEQEILGWAAQEAAEYRAEQEQRGRDGKPLDGGPCGPEWKRFYSRFPKSSGYYRVSRVLFSNDHRRAYVQIEGEGSTWNENVSYSLRWTKRGWKRHESGGGVGVC